MIPLLLVLSVANAQPGRTVAGLSGAWVPHHRPGLRGALDYGVVRGLAVTAEVGTLPGGGGVAAGLGPMAELLDGKWWRVGLVAMPELSIPLGVAPVPGLDLHLGGARLLTRGGLRVSWLAFWGLSFTARADHVLPFDGSGSWSELGFGLAVRM